MRYRITMAQVMGYTVYFE